MESGVEHNQKRAEAAKLICATVERMRNEYGIDAEIIDDTETVLIKLKNSEGEIVKEMGFMKNSYLPIDAHNVSIEDVVEARMRFPDEDVAEAVARINEKQTGA